MDVEPYVAAVHHAEVAQWLGDRRLRATMLESPPEVGLIVPCVAVGFLIQTDARVAIIEGMLTNPDADAATRLRALRMLFLSLLDAAKDRGVAEVWGMTSIPEMELLGRRLGFRVDPDKYWFGSKRV